MATVTITVSEKGDISYTNGVVHVARGETVDWELKMPGKTTPTLLVGKANGGKSFSSLPNGTLLVKFDRRTPFNRVEFVPGAEGYEAPIVPGSADAPSGSYSYAIAGAIVFNDPGDHVKVVPFMDGNCPEIIIQGK